MYKRLAITGTFVALLSAYIFWGTDFIYSLAWSQSSPERANLTEELENAKKKLDYRIVVDESLAQKLTEARDALKAETEIIPKSIEIEELIHDMLSLADENRINIVPLRTTTWTDALIGGYSRYQIQLQVGGNADDIMDFITGLESGDIYPVVTANLQLNGEAIGHDGQSAAVEGVLIVSVYTRV
jgi:Tfp pilus assembly protein PilO